MNKIKAFLAAHPPVQSALRVFTYVFIAGFGAAALGFVNDIQEWLQPGAEGDFPAIEPVVKAAAAAFIAAVSAVFSFVWNTLGFTKTAVYTELPPPPQPPVAN